MGSMLKVRNITLGEGDAKICVPVMGKDKKELVESIRDALNSNPDIIEIRWDYIEHENVIEVLKEVRRLVNDTAVIFTFRTSNEGGEKAIQQKEYAKLNLQVAQSGLVDLIDVEIMSNMVFAKDLIEEIHMFGTYVIGSNHNFNKTPSYEEIETIIKTIEFSGADVCKMAVMPNEKDDVSRLINVSKKVSKELSVPMVVMSMGELGAVTRVCTDMTNSSITFASCKKASAPGQLNIEILKDIRKKVAKLDIDYNIALIGFMGTGKTTVSQALSRITGLSEIDVDQYIVETEGMEISDIFKEKGEDYFRQIETEALRKISREKGQIISCGGGVVLKQENIDIIKENGVIVMLYATPETIFERVRHSTARPLLNENMCIEHVTELMNVREPKYNRAADIRVNVDANDRVLACYDILKQLSNR